MAINFVKYKGPDQDWAREVEKNDKQHTTNIAFILQRLGLSNPNSVTVLGGGGGGGGGTAIDATARALANQALTDLDRPRTTITLTAATGTGTFTAPEAFRIVSITTSALTGMPRLRLYRSSADRTADSARPYTTAAPTDGSVLAEIRWTTAGLTWAPGYISSLIAGSTTVYYNIDAGTATFDIIYVRED